MGLQSTLSHHLPHCSLLAKVPTLAEVRGRSVYSRRLERLWTFVENHYSDPDIRLTDAARHSGVSPDHLNLLLHRFAGTTFHHLLSRYRVEKCLELLREKNYTLTEAYSRCGFNSPTTFDRQFKKWVGCLPSEYKRSITFLRESGADTKLSITIFE
jgi:AraC-like DNA-binding protein